MGEREKNKKGKEEKGKCRKCSRVKKASDKDKPVITNRIIPRKIVTTVLTQRKRFQR